MSFNGIALAAHIGQDEKEALEFAEKAIRLSEKTSDSLSILAARERFAQALIWNGKFRKAEDFIEKMASSYGDAVRILALKATLGMYTGNFRKSIKNYRQILEKDSASFDGNLGIANAYFAHGEIKKAKLSAEKTLEFYQNQQDAEQFLEKLDKSFAPVFEEDFSYSFDNGDNKAIASSTGFKMPLSTKFEVAGSYTWRKTRNSLSGLEARSNQFNLSAAYVLMPGIKLRANGGFLKASSSETGYTNFVGEVAAQTKPFLRNDLEVGYRRDIQDFNAELLNRKIAGNHFFLNNNYSTAYGLGWYLQYLHTEQSDENSRELLFTSVYYSFLKKPVLKGGLNYQFISFKEQMPEVYFSPQKFQTAEVFLSLLSNNPQNGFLYEFTGATGFQSIEGQEKQATYRLQAKMGYNISSRFNLSLYGNHSNIASATAAGFTFTQFGLNLRWLISKQPVFNF